MRWVPARGPRHRSKSPQELADLLNAGHVLSVTAVTDQLTVDFSTDHLVDVTAADADGDGYFDITERAALFAAFDTSGDDEISPEELTEALGAGHGVEEPLTAAQELIDLLNIGGAPPD
jgi:hypothetical protein